MILVTGATGNVGRELVPLLLAEGESVRALVRNPERAGLPAGVDAVRGDLTDPASLDGTLDDVDAVFLLWPFFSSEGAAPIVDAITRSARRVVYLSSMTVLDGEDQPGVVWAEIEDVIERPGLEWTFLRPGGFATNTLVWAPQIRETGVVRWPYGAASRSLIHERDIASVAARALTENGHSRAKYVLTGPESITQIEQVAAISEAIGRSIHWEGISREGAREQLEALFGDPSFVDGALDYWESLVYQPEPVTPTVQDILGRPAISFREWAADHTADFGGVPAAVGRRTG